MKKFYLTLTAIAFTAGIFAQAPTLIKSNLEVEHKATPNFDKTVVTYGKTSQKSSTSRATTISEWISPIDLVANFNGTTPYLAYCNPMFPDSNVIIDWSSGPGAPWLHLVSQTIQLGGALTTFTGGVFDPAIQPYDADAPVTIDSIAIQGYYARENTSVTDTAIVYVSARNNGNFNRGFDFANPDSAKYVLNYLNGSNSVNNPDSVVATYKILLNDAFKADSFSNGGHMFEVAAGLTLNNSQGLLAISIEFRSGTTYSQATDTIFSNTNWMNVVYATPSGENATFPLGGYQDYTIGSFCNGANNKYGTIDYHILPTQFTGDHPYQLYDMNIKIAQTNAQTAGINELENGARLFQNYPNPTNGNTTIKYSLENEASIAFELIDVTGKKVMSVNKGNQNSGTYTMDINTSDLNSGIYFYSILVNGNKITKKMTITK